MTFRSGKRNAGEGAESASGWLRPALRSASAPLQGRTCRKIPSRNPPASRHCSGCAGTICFRKRSGCRGLSSGTLFRCAPAFRPVPGEIFPDPPHWLCRSGLGCRSCYFLLKAPVCDFSFPFSLWSAPPWLLPAFQYRFLLRGLAARCGKLLLIQHHVDILADIFQCGDVRLQGFQLGVQLCAAGLQRRKFGIQCRKIHRCAAVQLHQGADSFVKRVQFILVLGSVSVLGQLEVLLDKGIMDGLQLGMGGGSILDLAIARIRFSFCFNCPRRGAAVWFKLSMAWFKSSTVFRE